MAEERHELRALIKKKFRTQEILAHELGVTDSYLSKIVRGFNTPTWGKFGHKLAWKLGITKKRYMEIVGR